jgi:hypothetical protein
VKYQQHLATALRCVAVQSSQGDPGKSCLELKDVLQQLPPEAMGGAQGQGGSGCSL